MRKIHFAIQEATEKVASGKVDFVRVTPKVSIQRVGIHLVLVYCGRVIASRTRGHYMCHIYKGYMWDSRAAVGYYRAFFNDREHRYVIYKKSGQVIIANNPVEILEGDFYSYYD